MNEPNPPDGKAERIDASVWKVTVVAVMGPFMAQVDSTVVNVSLSTLSHTLGSPIAIAQWIVTGYLLAMALTLPLNGWLVDRLGAKRLYLICFSTFTLASFLCGASSSMSLLICARVFQGLIGGVMAPMTQMMIARVAGRHMARVMGYAALPILLAPVLGPVLAGTILAHASWSWLFYLNVPVGIAGVGLATWLLPRDLGALQKRPFDFFGFALISPGLVALIDGLQNSTRVQGFALLLAGALLLAAFVWHSARKGAAALIDVRIFADRVFSTAAATQFFTNGLLFGRQLVVPLFLIAGCQMSVEHAGWLIAATGVGMMCSFPLLGFLTERYGCRAVAAGGALLATLGTSSFVWMIEYRFSPAVALVSLFLAGAGQGTISIPSITAAYASIPKARLAVANTALNIAQRIGGPVATTLLALVLSLTMAHPALHAASVGPRPFFWPFVLLAVLHLLAFATAMRLPPRIQREPEAARP
ncbi:DHA2 family efflux MFS transporter permease subunit [Paraburkholderia sp. BCC1886]|uniref:DHA2 family efflux MFS transporter permease subunit n=1 Tax=Paraburkholderia sp. BCC1886 TaxID=2562670 RepID=UPI0021B2DB15|nr:DHA2 family efflux MFS transporter permease subunit [Paraburkholderia sp. BCC1886]